ncbi:phosphoglucomutase (alpha-D-glucose-1,6-bisphosphate-dependent) [Corynebacterium confusum]|uniref:phosphoglucomutase (alpha-D-glucose-1,6-bisphosphate-dependent) n=1 Tax=Corynebacterium confusum TaxID=71254 RepID=UPI0025B50E87|nr:phosphoglucomutase (alpha-D-glucose-1,6-bisphosphate-dependent) [Corynebacterium confusum]WJY90402.1 Phosphoglucomutase [Corynebacterium confusum]
MAHPRAGQPARPEDRDDIAHVVTSYYALRPDVRTPGQEVVFGTSGHRGSSLDAAFNEWHIWAITQAIVDYRTEQGIAGPLFIGRDTHALSEPAMVSALQVLVARGVDVRVDARGGYTPTPAVSRAIVAHPGSDGIVVTPSHNPPRDGGFKYNPPSGGPADSAATDWIAERANGYLRAGLEGVERADVAGVTDPNLATYDFLDAYVGDLDRVVDLRAIAKAGVRIGADPMGGAAVDYWPEIARRYGLQLTVVNPHVDATFGFMTLDKDGQIRMDCSSPAAMASLIANRDSYDIATGNDADADRHGIVTPDAGLMNPNHYLAVAVDYLFSHRPDWAGAGIGKTVVSSSLIDRVAGRLERKLVEVPVGFKWFVSGLQDASLAFGGEESAGAAFLCFDGSTWTTDKDGIIMNLLAAEIQAVTGQSPSQRYQQLTEELGSSAYARIDEPADRAAKAVLKGLAPDAVAATQLAGEEIRAKLTEAPGNGAALGGLKVVTDNAWFAARPSGTEDKYKIYAESFLGEKHLEQVLQEAVNVVKDALSSAT